MLDVMQLKWSVMVMIELTWPVIEWYEIPQKDTYDIVIGNNEKCQFLYPMGVFYSLKKLACQSTKAQLTQVIFQRYLYRK